MVHPHQMHILDLHCMANAPAHPLACRSLPCIQNPGLALACPLLALILPGPACHEHRLDGPDPWSSLSCLMLSLGSYVVNKE